MSQGHCRGDGGITKTAGSSAEIAICDGEGDAVERRRVITGDVGDVMDDIRNPTEDFLTITPEPIPAVSQRRAGVETEEADNRRDDFREEMRDEERRFMGKTNRDEGERAMHHETPWISVEVKANVVTADETILNSRHSRWFNDEVPR